jgi:endonuclease/exonuclease/phosphatase family metal-dependent hydrolase
MMYALAACWLAFLALRLVGADGSRLTAAALALTPYVAGFGLVVGVAGAALLDPVGGGLLLAVALVLAGLVLPRAFGSKDPLPGGPRLRVLSVNLYLGRADPAAVVALAREHRVDVLSLQELTAEAAERLTAAGLPEVLPYAQFEILEYAHGSGLAARHPLLKRDLARRSLMAQPSALVDLPGAAEIEVVAVHPMPPVRPHGAANWKRELAGLPGARPTSPLRLLAGDFNATLDHGALRALLRRGYRDAAAAIGAGLRPTWPTNRPLPPVTLDHVLVDTRCAVTEFRVLSVPGSDHRAVLAEIVLPIQ